MTAAIGVVQDLTTGQQKFFGGAEKEKSMHKYERNWPVHQDDIMDIHVVRSTDGCLAVTGECGAKSSVHVWDTDLMKSYASFSLGG